MLDELPEAFLARMERLLGSEYGQFLASYQVPPAVGLRVNTLKVSPRRFLALTPFNLTSIPGSPAGFLVSGGELPGRHPYHAAGLYYLQDPAAMAVTELLNPQPGERVLDLAAAPGGKATHIASLMQNEGLLVANEIHPKRVWALAGNLERWGARNAVITNEAPDRLADHFGNFFDRVLVDAPCSGEGMFRKSETARTEWTPELVSGCAMRQSAILNEAARMVRPGGWLAYATCTFAPEENEGVVARFACEHPEFELVEPPRRPGCEPGRPDWVDEGDRPSTALRRSSGHRLPELRRTVRLWPHRGPGEGHFVALLRRNGSGTGETPRSRLPDEVSGQVRRLYEAFCREHLIAMPASDHLALAGSYLYRVPAALPVMKDLRVVHPGWWLGTIKRNRFEPSHALAMSLTVHDVHRAINLAPDSYEVLAYLRGETLRVAGDDGWVMVAVDVYPLGWGKRVRGIVKNRYPRGLRWL
ncbi:MAG: RsmB/NOP family class I SAM-dependent RNA methyltransferase [Anaerolineae bacterium]